MLRMRALGYLCMFFLVLPGAAQAAFGYKDVVDRAEKLAASPYHEAQKIPDWLKDLGYESYQNIRFDPDQSLWRKSRTKFQVMLVPAGLFYTHPVKLNVIDSSGVAPIGFDKALFTFSDPDLEKRIPADLGYAGFKLTFPFSGKDSANQFLVFAGASYLRGVGSKNAFGISARGIAVDTGLTSGEEFPSFTEFWLVRPSPDADTMTVYALLDGPSLAGAYQIVVHPGETTQLDVKATLFPRKKIQLTGVAPLTSMFLYGENTPRFQGHWRPEVHDSDGLLIHDDASGEWLWRPLIDPQSLQADYFQVQRLQGFGLLQRDNAFADYQDLGAHYERRPSAWVEPGGDWGKGSVVLIQLPTPDETNDNIVAFWTPGDKLKPGKAYQFDYGLKFGDASLVSPPLGQTVNTFVGAGDIVGGGKIKDTYRLIVDLQGGALDKLGPTAKVTAQVSGVEGTQVVEQFVEYNPQLKAWRLSILAKPAGDRPLMLRGFLQHEDQAVSETWTYRLPVDNNIRGGAS